MQNYGSKIILYACILSFTVLTASTVQAVESSVSHTDNTKNEKVLEQQLVNEKVSFSDTSHTHASAYVTGMLDPQQIPASIARTSALAQKASLSHRHNIQDFISGKLDQKYIDSDITRDNELARGLSLKSERNHNHHEDYSPKSYVLLLESRIAKLEQTVNNLTALLKNVERDGQDIFFNGVNVHIVNGTGHTDGPPNGLGNLIVGYNEPRKKSADNNRNGSHNVVVGDMNNYASYGGIVVGLNNTISGGYASVNGGKLNSATGDLATVNGGYGNTSIGAYSAIGGGRLNKTTGQYATVGGGMTRTAEASNNWRGGKLFSEQ